MKRPSSILFLLLILLWGCSAHKTAQIPPNIRNLKNLTVIPDNTQSAHQISINKDEDYKGSGKVIIGSIHDFAVDDSGRVFVSDPRQNTIDVFEPDGRYLTHLGRKGKGPGEFYRVWDVQVEDHKLFAYDLTQFRYNVFSLDSLNFLYTVKLARNRNNVKKLSGTGQSSDYVRNNDTFLAAFDKKVPVSNTDWGRMNIKSLYYLLGKNGNITSKKLFEVTSKAEVLVPYHGGVTSRQGNHMSISRIGFHPAFYGKSLTVLSNDNQIFQVWSDDFLIKVYSPEGKYQRSIYYPYQKIPLTRESAVAAGVHDFILKGWNSIALPKTWPVLNNMKIDNKSRLWVSTIVKDPKVYQWWVLNQKGKLLARFDWPRNKPIKVAKNDYIYTQETDTSDGKSEVVRYQFALK